VVGEEETAVAVVVAATTASLSHLNCVVLFDLKVVEHGTLKHV